MACYDCEDCSLWRENGGKCTRFEYDCPFQFYEELFNHKDETEQINILIKNIIDANDKIQEILTSINVYGIDTLDYFSHAVDELKEHINNDMYKEWLEIQIGNEKE